MDFNAFIVDWTVNDYDILKEKLAGAGFEFAREGATPHIRVQVPLDRVEVFAAICQAHMNAPFNYVDVQYPAHKTTVIIFQTAVHTITNQEENARVKALAVQLGLPPDQADWVTSF